eukprot:CAMPEP_0201714150 /NCGR_PEP_ID=MMETSP0593-20130828/742_1 /ASSEMBLY_ACC=CAM_ASM_000672 /TAXON_ID=267983 /ORGANISM="Skeletonema japonicum, Strain CCMP2506" /LENGTH=766 /DNA_ID=CAMNT_0048203399 /DNA_START=85 /DNA_END=2385 /DNA_ORIENTATION=+
MATASSSTDNNDNVVGLPPLPSEPAIVNTTTTTTTAAVAATTAPAVAAVGSQKLKTLQRSLKSTIQFKSDLNKSTRSTCSCGILHVVSISVPPTVGRVNSSAAAAAAGAANANTKEEHCFVWISNLFHLDKALDHLKKFGFYSDNEDSSSGGGNAGDEDADVKPAAVGEGTSSSINLRSLNTTNVTFIPYSSRSNWCYKYPMAFPHIHVDLQGNVSGYPHWSSEGSASMQNVIPFGNAASSSMIGGGSSNVLLGGGAGGIKSGSSSFQLFQPATSSTTTNTAVGIAAPTLPPLPIALGTANSERLFPAASISNEARSQLHSQIYTYFTWLKTELLMVGNTNTNDGDGADGNAMMINGIGNLLHVMESTFGQGVATNSEATAAAASGNKRKASSQSMMAMMDAEDKPPLLERGLIEPLNQLVVESTVAASTAAAAAGGGGINDGGNEDESSSKRRKSAASGSGRGSGAGSGGNAPLDFDDMYNRLLTFKAQFGHVNVPQGYKEDKQLGSWVTNIRYKRKCLQKNGQDYEVEDEDDADLLGVGGGGMNAMPELDATNMMGLDGLGMMASASNTKRKDGPSGSKAKRKKKRLSQERIAQLDRVGFAWSHDKQYKSWDERFNDLQEYKRVNGNTRVPRSSGSLGEWVHMQRKMYHKNDKNFMAKRAPRLEAIGFEWRTRKYDLVSWEDNFQNLVKFGTENQHYNVPSPMDVTQDEAVAGGPSIQEQEEANRFYKWVKRTRAEYKSLMGGKSSRMLTEERVAKLRQIGFIV